MGKSLVTTLLKRHVNIYSDLYTLCFLHSYVQSPESRAQPQGHITAPNLCLIVFRYQVFGQQSRLVLELRSHWYHPSGAAVALSEGLNRNKPHCFRSPKAAATRTQEAVVDQPEDSVSSCSQAGSTCFCSPGLQGAPSSRVGLGPTPRKWLPAGTCLLAPLPHSRLRRGRESSWGVMMG